MTDHQPRMADGELSAAFECNDLSKMVQLTKGLPAKARKSLHAVVEVFQQRRPLGMTPLISAILHRNDRLAEMLIRENVDMNQALEKDFRWEFDLRRMVDFYKEASNQISRGPSENIFSDYSKTSPMFWAIRMNNLWLVEKIMTCPGFEKNSLVEKVNGMSALMLAVLDNNMAACRAILKHGVDLHMADFNGKMALDVALDKKLDDMIRFFLTVGESPNCTRHSFPPLVHAIIKGSLRLMRILIEKGADVHQAVSKGKSTPPLLYAIGGRQFEPAKLLVRMGADTNVMHDGVTALRLLANLKLEGPDLATLPAAIVDMAKFLVKHGADVNAQNSLGDTALFCAVNSMNVKLVSYLLSVNAITNTKNHNSLTPLHVAIIPSNATSAMVTVTSETEVSRHSGGGYTVNTPYIVPYQREMVELLLDAGANLHAKDESLHTPMFLSVGNNNLEMAELLIRRGAEVNGKNIDGTTLLHFATKENNLNMVKCLVEIGKADVNIVTRNGDTPLHLAVSIRSTNVVRYLVDAKANVNVDNCFHLAPINIAVARDSSKLVTLLGNAGANFNSRTRDGSLLHCAIQFRNLKAVKSLLELGADVNIGDENKVTPFMVCIINFEYKSEFVQLLLDYGGDPLRPNKGGMTGYMSALARHEADLLKILWRHGCPADEMKIAHFHKALKKDLNKSRLLQHQHPSTYSFFSERQITKEEDDLRCAQSLFTEGIMKNEPKLVADAIENGAVARGVTHSMPYPLHYAISKGYHEVVRVLLTNGVPVNFVDADRRTPLELAAIAGDLIMCQLLLSHGAHYNPGLGSAVCRFHVISKRVDEEREVLLKREEKMDETLGKINGNLTTRLNKLEQRTKEEREIRDTEVRRMDKELRKLKKETLCCMKESSTEAKALKNEAKSLRELEKKLKSCQCLLTLFIDIRKQFMLIRKQDSRNHNDVMSRLEKYVKAETTLACMSLLNCVDKTGNTLMAAAVKAGNVQITEYIMNLRLNHNKICLD